MDNWPVWRYRLVAISLVLIIIGALNWASIGLFNKNIVKSVNDSTFRSESFERFVYILIGLAGLYILIDFWFIR